MGRRGQWGGGEKHVILSKRKDFFKEKSDEKEADTVLEKSLRHCLLSLLSLEQCHLQP